MMEFQTKTIHAGQHADPLTGAIIAPIYQTSTFSLEDIGKSRGYEYSRAGNPTRTALEECLASLENAKYCLTFSSGVNAASAILSLLRPGDHIIATEDLYGGTYRLFEEIYNRQYIKVTYVSGDNPENFAAAINENTKLVWIESPTNPLLKLIDIEAVAEICRDNSVLLCIDNTFATPYFQNPLQFGADIILHSTTKYIGGHSDVIGGAVITNNPELYENIRHYQYVVGGIPSPFDSWLTLRGVKTLAVRMDRHEENAKQVAAFLKEHPLVQEVFYPGLEEHSQYDLAKKQMTGFGGMVSFKLKGGKDDVSLFFRNLKLFHLAVSLGGVESLACHPASMTHGTIPDQKREQLGITDNLIRLSVGIEHINNLLEDLNQALNSVKQAVLV
jgi:cystathionine beta-lyase/cystathionine gamma-synthase